MVGRGGRFLVCALATLIAGPAAALSSPNSFCVGDPCVISADKDADPDIALDFGTRTVVLQQQLNMLPLPTGALGSLTIRCGTFRITGDGVLKGTSATGPGGAVVIEALNGIELNGLTSLGDIRLTGQDAGSLMLRTSVGSITGNGRLNLGAGGGRGCASETARNVKSPADPGYPLRRSRAAGVSCGAPSA
jgi:hypothetical protein